MTLSDRHLATLRAVCDAFVPAVAHEPDPHGFWSRRASDLGVAEHITELVGTLDRRAQRELVQLLALMSSPALGLTWRGPLKPFTALDDAQRETLLQRWAVSPVPQLRKGYLSLKKLTSIFFYGYAEPDAPNPNWPALGYPGPIAEPPNYTRPIEPVVPAGDLTLSCETVVVGSGAGGGVIAGELAEAGHDVIVVEKGPYVDRDAFDGLELAAMDRMYEQRGAAVTRDGAVGVLAGSCVGGGTTINWAGSFRTPDAILRQWADAHDAPHFTGRGFQQSLDTLQRDLSVGADATARHNPQNAALERGCRALGYHAEDIPRNQRLPESEDAWRRIGYSPFGDRDGLKQSMLPTFLQRAVAHGARILADTTVERVTMDGGRATGVTGFYENDGKRHSVTIRAERVVVAAGSLHTPALLIRSGVQHPHIGRHLFFHPTVAVAARYADPTESWFGPMMSVVSNEFAHLDGLYGAKLETPPAHVGLLGLVLPWRSGVQHKTVMAQADHLGTFIVLTRDRDGGRVTVGRDGQPILNYRLSAYDRDHMLRGVAEAARIHFAAGAEELFFLHNTAPSFSRERGEAAFEAFLDRIPHWGWKPNQYPLNTAHQMGTCRMGGRDADHPVAPDGQVRGVAGLYVADASCFPESSGVNPMLTIQAIAHHTAQGLKSTPARPARRSTAAAAA